MDQIGSFQPGCVQGLVRAGEDLRREPVHLQYSGESGGDEGFGGADWNQAAC
jgi:hypothetical protein